jgi:hypothetical protein
MKDTATAALMGAIVGYFIHRHWPEIEWLVRILTG